MFWLRNKKKIIFNYTLLSWGLIAARKSLWYLYIAHICLMEFPPLSNGRIYFGFEGCWVVNLKVYSLSKQCRTWSYAKFCILASDMVLHCLPMSLLKDARLIICDNCVYMYHHNFRSSVLSSVYDRSCRGICKKKCSQRTWPSPM